MTPPENRERVQSVDRSLMLMEAIASHGGSASLAEVVAATGLPVATVHRLATTLIAGGFLRRGGGRQYELGVRLHRSGEIAGRVTARWAQPVLTEIVAGTGETANLAIREGDGVVYLAQVPSPHSMRMFTEVGRTVEIHCTAVGKVLVAELGDDQIRQMLRRAGMPRYTESTIIDPEVYLAEIHKVRELGFASDEAEQEEGVRCVAVTAGSGQGAVALSASGPEARFTPERRDAAVAVLRSAAAHLAH